MNLSLRNQVRIATGTVVFLGFLSHAFFVGAGSFLEGWEFWIILFAIVLGIGVNYLLSRRVVTRYRDAVGREDLPVAKRQYEMLRDFWGRRGEETLKSYSTNLLILEGRYREALEELQALDIRRIGVKGAPVITTNIAWCLVQLGEPTKALEVVQPALSQLESMGADAAGSGSFVVGAAYLLQGKLNEAVLSLERAKSKGSPSRKSAVLFYLGEAYAALGKVEEARQAYRDAHETLPGGRFGIRALERLQ